jgi:hypothetical protein
MRFFQFLLLLSLSCLITAPVSAECMKDGAVVSLKGKLGRETFPGAPNYTSIANGDEPETVWILTLPAPQCFSVISMEDGSLLNSLPMTRFQLVVSEEQYKLKRNLLDRTVVVKGVIFQGISGHHHTAALIDAR